MIDSYGINIVEKKPQIMQSFIIYPAPSKTDTVKKKSWHFREMSVLERFLVKYNEDTS